MTIYTLRDRLRGGRTVRVGEDEIVATVAAWLAELGVRSPLVESLGWALRHGDWPAAYVIADFLSVDVAVAA